MALALAGIFSDNMVLQYGIRVPVWGQANPGAKVSVAFAGQTQRVTADAEGCWRVRLDAMLASREPAVMTVKAKNAKGKDEVVKLANVVVGEVWLCSGQSNMEWPVSAANNAETELAGANQPAIRLYNVSRVIATEPRTDISGAQWHVCTPETAANFSAVGYFFGRELQQRLDVPIGLINASWGGTVAEAWTSREGLLSEPELASMVERFDRDLPNLEKLQDAWNAEARAIEERTRDTQNLGFARGWAALAAPGGDWQDMDLPQPWQNAGLNFSGIFWFRREVELPAAWAGRPLRLSIGPCDKSDNTYFNNVEVGSVTMAQRQDAWSLPRTYTVPGELVKAGRNVIAVRVHSNIYNGGMTGPAAMMLVRPADDDAAEPISLAGSWRYAIEANYGLVQMPPAPPGPNNPNFPTALYCGMIAPLVSFALRGVIWYQGESNADRPKQYRTLFPTLIKDWRRLWDQGDFPFLFVQLANYMTRPDKPVDSQWAALREAQTMTLDLLNTGMATAIDIGEANDVHPRNKQEVGRRLALNALARVYEVSDLTYSGPMLQDIRHEDGAMYLSFRHADGGLVCRGPKLASFAIAGSDRKFVWAQAVICRNEVVVSHPAVPAPVSVRYAWADNPDCTLYNGAGLPAVPFRTDDW